MNSLIILEELKKRLDQDLERHKWTGVGSYIHILKCDIQRLIERETDKIQPMDHVDNETFENF